MEWSLLQYRAPHVQRSIFQAVAEYAESAAVSESECHKSELLMYVDRFV